MDSENARNEECGKDLRVRAPLGQQANTGELAPARDARGRFLPGVSGNPSGRPADEREIRALARSHAPECIEKLLTLMRSAVDERVQLAAAEALLSRGYGRPPQPVEHGGMPLVSIDMRGAGPSGGAGLTPSQAYNFMLSGHLDPDPAHPAFRPAIEVRPAEPEPEEPK